MALMDFIKKQFIDIIEWTEDSDGTLAWRFPMDDREIQNGGSLTVRESQIAMFVNEGKVADVVRPRPLHADDRDAAGPHLPAELGQALQVARSRATSTSSARASRSTSAGARRQPVTIRDKDFGAVRLRAFGNYSYRIADPQLFYNEISGTRERYTVDRARRPAARADAAAHLATRSAQSGMPFLDLAANQVEFAQGAAGRDRAGVREARPEARGGDGAERVAARGAAEDPRPEDRHGHGRQRHGQVHAVPDRAGDPDARRRCRRARAAASPATRWAWAPASRSAR